MSGFTHDEQRYGDRLVYELSEQTVLRMHRNCDCPAEDLERVLDAHLPLAGFEVLAWGAGFVAVVGPEIADYSPLRLYEALTALPTPTTSGRHAR